MATNYGAASVLQASGPDFITQLIARSNHSLVAGGHSCPKPRACPIAPPPNLYEPQLPLGCFGHGLALDLDPVGIALSLQKLTTVSLGHGGGVLVGCS